jgi:hypothetical protein
MALFFKKSKKKRDVLKFLTLIFSLFKGVFFLGDQFILSNRVPLIVEFAETLLYYE